MDKTKRILLALTIALALFIVVNYVITSSNERNVIELPIACKDIKRGEKIEVCWTKATYTKELETIYGKLLKKTNQELVAVQKITKGSIINSDLTSTDNNIIQNYENEGQIVTIPISNSSYGVGFQIRKKDIVNVYFTGKTKDVNAALNGKEKLYSNDLQEGLVTCKLLENVEILATFNNVGEETAGSEITDVIIKVEKEQAMLISNLKSQGSFDITLVN